MRFENQEIAGVVRIVPDRRVDERGSFARTWDRSLFVEHGLNPDLAQCSTSFNRTAGTVRGMHYQAAPASEAKLVRVTRGAIYDVALDLRSDSPTFGRWQSFELTADNGEMLYIPEGVAHGFQTLADDTEVFYMISAVHQSEAARGVRWNDPAFSIRWPLAVTVMSDRDRHWPDFVSGGDVPTASPVSQALGAHYAQTFARHGATPAGVDWGTQESVDLRYQKMLEVVQERASGARPSLLDVGCGYGGLLTYARQKDIQLEYTGIDLAANMIRHARETVPDALFVHGDVLLMPQRHAFDYVVCNGVLTQKLTTSVLEMNRFAHTLIAKLFDLCRVGAAFNVMSNQVNFMVDNLYYRSPTELLNHCLTQLTRRVRLEHAYPLYEYTVYLYRE